MAEWFTPHVVRVIKGTPADGADRSSLETAGTGVLVAPGKVLTCAHVVAHALSANKTDKDALQSQIAHPTGDIFLELNPLSGGELVKAVVAHQKAWKPVSENPKQSLQDIALVTVAGAAHEATASIPIAAERKHPKPVGFYGFGKAKRGWRTGTYRGRDVHLDQIEIDRPQAWHGYSGAGVYCDKEEHLLGMLVAVPKGDDQFDIYMTHAELFVPFLKSNSIQVAQPEDTPPPKPSSNQANALVNVFYRMLNRAEQVAFIEPFLYPKEYQFNDQQPKANKQLAPLCTMVVECLTADMPAFLAHKIMALQYFRSKNLSSLALDKVEAVSMVLSVGQRFRVKLEDQIGMQLEQWFKHHNHNLVVYVKPTQTSKIVDLVKGLVAQLESLHKAQPTWPHQLLVLVPFFTDELNVISRKLAKIKLGSQQSAYCTITKPLNKIRKNDVHHFWDDLPKIAREKYLPQFEDDLGLQVSLPDDGIRYETFANDFKQLLNKTYQSNRN